MNTAVWLLAQVGRRRLPLPESGWTGWLTDSRNGVFVVLALALFLGGGRKVFQAMRARKAVAELEGDRPNLAAISEAPSHGRAAVMELFRLLGSSSDRTIRDAAGQALAVLWKADELIPEEEQALVTRGLVVNWFARRRYPRSLDPPIPIVVEFGLPFLARDGVGVGPDSLEWSYRILGANRASLETFGSWVPGEGRAAFMVNPRDFPTNGPHRLVLHARVRTTGLTTIWERELPQVPFSFEFDPILNLDALFTLPDASREAAIIDAISLVQWGSNAGESEYVSLGEEFALRNPPALRILGPLPCDLAHAMVLEIEGASGPIAIGDVVLVGNKLSQQGVVVKCRSMPGFQASPLQGLTCPGKSRGRLVLTPDAHRAWANPEIRSVWPGSLATEWTTIEVVRQ
ncbi:MAG: hypothetical protein JWN86_2864 [Planctomycetota bacterium]|nr:hypothetical protein [Planctomycetota bacterium]